MPKNEFADPAGGGYSTPPDSLAVNGVGPREGGGKRRRGEGRRGVGREGMGREGEGLSPRAKILATALCGQLLII